MTALTLYYTNGTSGVLSHANKLVTVTGGGLTNYNSTIGKAVSPNGWGELYSQGTSNPWAAASGMLSPDGGGWLWVDTTLADGSASFNPGTWTISIPIKTNTGSITANIHTNIYIYSSSGVYTPILKMSLSGQSITSTFVTFVISSITTTASPTFQTGDQLYADIQLNVTANTVNSTTLLGKINIANSATLGNTSAQIVSPGYTTITQAQKDAVTRFRFSSPTQLHFVPMRLRLASGAASVLKDASMLFSLIGKKKKDAVMRLRTQHFTSVMLFAQMRLYTAKAKQKDAAIRFRFSIYSHSALFPNATRRTGKFPSATRRQTV